MSEFAKRGQAAVARDDMPDAARWFAKAVEQDPADAASRAWLGQCLCGIGERARGAAELREAGSQFAARARSRDDVPLLLELAEELQHWSDFPGAQLLIEAALRLDAENAQAFRLLALGHAQINHPAEALDAGRRALALSPGGAALIVFVGSLEADAGDYAAANARLARLLAGPLDAGQAFRAHKEMARVLDRTGECGAAFAHLRAAGALAGQVPEIAEKDVEAMPAIIRANQASFGPDVMVRWAGADLPREREPPVFLVGFMRSGTTLTQEVLGAHPDVFVSDESDLITATLRELHRMDPARLGTADKLRRLGRDGVIALRAFYWESARRRFGDIRARVFIDKFTMNSIDAGFISAIFPDARMVFVQRHPRDVCLSCFMQLMVPSLTTVQLLDWERTARFYAQVMGWWRHIRPLMTMPVLEFRYEDAVSAFEDTFRRVFALLDLQWDPGVAAFHERARGRFIASPSRAQVARPLYASSVERWRRYEAEFAPVASILAPIERTLGYRS